MEGVVDLGGVAIVVAVNAGDVERVEGAFTAMESLVEVVDNDVCEPVLRMEAARRGRADALIADAIVFAELRLIRAASWFNEGGRRAAAGRSGFGACIEACKDCNGGGLDIVRHVDDELGGPCGKRQDRHPTVFGIDDSFYREHCIHQIPPALPANWQCTNRTSEHSRFVHPDR